MDDKADKKNGQSGVKDYGKPLFHPLNSLISIHVPAHTLISQITLSPPHILCLKESSKFG